MKLKDKIEEILEKAGVEYRFITLPADLPPDVPSHAAFHGIKLANAMATLLYKTEKGILGAVKRADTQIDQEKLKKFAGVKELAFASKADLTKLGTQVGMVPYLGLEVKYFVDKKVLEIDKAYGTGGDKLIGMVMNSADMIKVNKGTVGDYTYFESNQVSDLKNKRIVSGITPSGDGTLHIGNYLGAVKQFIEIAKSNECFLFVADLHALTTIQKKAQLQKNVETLILNELALLKGFLTPEQFSKIIFYRQSDIGLHPQLQTIINNVTPLGLLKRAHAYKDKLAKDVMEDDINLGLFNYPILMAADIMLYKPDFVPVGKDQKQHVEITRDIAARFNKIYCGVPDSKTGTRRSAIFKLPEPYIPEEVAVVLGTDGKRKMSKTLGNIISIFESEETIKKQVNGTYTDPMRIHATDPGHTEGNMVFTYLDFFGSKPRVDEFKQAYKTGQVSDIEVKNYLFESLIKYFAPARVCYEELRKNPEMIKKILANGTEKAKSVASQTMNEVNDAIGLINKYSLNVSQFRHPELVSVSRKGDSGSEAGMTEITIDEFALVEERVGLVTEAENVEKSEKLIRLHVDFGDFGRRIIFTGVRTYGYTPEDFTGKQFLFVTNLLPRKMMNEESQGMILAVDSSASSEQAKPIFVSAEGMPLGAKIR